MDIFSNNYIIHGYVQLYVRGVIAEELLYNSVIVAMDSCIIVSINSIISVFVVCPSRHRGGSPPPACDLFLFTRRGGTKVKSWMLNKNS